MKFGLKGLLLNERRAVPGKMYGQSTGYRTVRRRFSSELSTNQPTFTLPPTWPRPPGIIRLCKRLRRTTAAHTHCFRVCPSAFRIQPNTKRGITCMVSQYSFDEINKFIILKRTKKYPTFEVVQLS